MFERMLLAVDGSAPSNRAVELAKDIGAKSGSDILVLHVREHDGGRMAPYGWESDEAGELVDVTVRQIKDAGVSARGELVRVPYGRAAREILAHAENEDVDVIVMGSRGTSDLAGLVMGSVTHKVLHLARCPVLVAR
jgi:nucleotide-binding universal stress UspA family protein